MPAPRKSLNNKRWRRVREMQLQREPLCRICKKRGIITPATEVDHIDGSYDDGYEGSNLQSVCKPCHSSKTWHQIRGREIRTVSVDGSPSDW